MKYGKSDVLSFSRLDYKRQISVLMSACLSICPSLSELSHVLALMKQSGETYVLRNRGRPLDNCQRGTEALNSIAHEELNHTKNHVSELRSESFPSRVFSKYLDCSLVRYPKAGDSFK